MPLGYLHLRNGATMLDYAGVELADMPAVRAEALRTVAEVLQEDDVQPLWLGMPLLLWITDAPGGAGHTLVTLNVTASASA